MHQRFAKAFLLPPLLLALLVPAPASAQDNDEELAKRYYKLGEELYNRADYEGALAQFQLSYKYSKRPALLFNIAKCHESLGQHEKAVEVYQEYLTSKPDNADVVQARIENLKRLIEKKKSEEKAPVVKTEPKVVAPPPPPPPRPRRSKAMKIAGWSLLGTGIALAAVGGICAGLIPQKQSDVEKARDDGAEYSSVKSVDDNGRQLQSGMILGFALGGAAAVAGAILLVLDWRAGAAEQRTSYLFPSPVSGGGAVVSGGFEF